MNLKTTVAGLEFKNPLLPASGPLVGDAEKMMTLAALGVGGMVSKTVSVKGAEVPRPCIGSGKNYITNAELWSEHPLEAWRDDIFPAVRAKLDLPLLVSVGYTKQDMETLIPQLDGFAEAFEVSTHYVGKDLSVISETVKTIRSLTDKPFFMKVSPHMPDPVAFCEMVLENGGNGIVAINSLGPAMAVDLATRSVPMGNSQGEIWMSGPVIKPLALAFISRIRRAIPECEIIGVGGIASADDVLEFLLAGASAVQMLSAAMLKGIDLYKKIVDDLPGRLEDFGFSSVREVIETDLIIPEVSYERRLPVVDRDACILCDKCVRGCPYLALCHEEDAILVDDAKCFGCTLCASVCPKNAISFEA
jgi:dihydroorotate dehydrogenase (fumarate)